jgi:hypothetical protein
LHYFKGQTAARDAKTVKIQFSLAVPLSVHQVFFYNPYPESDFYAIIYYSGVRRIFLRGMSYLPDTPLRMPLIYYVYIAQNELKSELKTCSSHTIEEK